MKSLKYVLLVCALISGFAFVGCKEKDPVEKASDAIKDAAEETGEAAKDAAKKVEDAAK